MKSNLYTDLSPTPLQILNQISDKSETLQNKPS